MFSVENFYYVLYTNLLKPANIIHVLFYPFGASDPDSLYHNMYGSPSPAGKSRHTTWYYDQEPINENNFYKCSDLRTDLSFNPTNKIRILANSEHSEIKDKLCYENKYLDWYYFFHGFATLDWYNDCQYLNDFEIQFTKVFITFNRLITKDRSYRLYFVSLLKEKNLLENGYVSLITKNNNLGTWEEELVDPNSRLSNKAKHLVEKNLPSMKNGLIIDDPNPPGFASANMGYGELSMFQSGLWHVVTETVFYDKKLHLTEKIFKPIISKRPFILIGAKGNLAYLKSYGFKTFDKWIDESYDNESDNDTRIEMVVDQLEKLCKFSQCELVRMHNEMKEILEYNFNHFFSNFKNIIVNELVDNFEKVILNYNKTAEPINQIEIDKIKLEEVKQIFLK